MIFSKPFFFKHSCNMFVFLASSIKISQTKIVFYICVCIYFFCSIFLLHLTNYYFTAFFFTYRTPYKAAKYTTNTNTHSNTNTASHRCTYFVYVSDLKKHSAQMNVLNVQYKYKNKLNKNGLLLLF